MEDTIMTVTCSTCSVDFNKPNYLAKKTNIHYCSRNCSNKIPKRWINHIPLKEQLKCKSCQSPIDYRSKSGICQACISEQSINKTKLTTVKDIKNKYKHWYSSAIRNFARDWNKHRLSSCQNCQYNKHVELCHIKSISSFPDEALLGDVNSESNILVLCPNCHWEFDNSLLNIQDLTKNGGAGGSRTLI